MPKETKKETYRYATITIDCDVEWEIDGGSQRRKSELFIVEIDRGHIKTGFSEKTREELFRHILEELHIKLS